MAQFIAMTLVTCKSERDKGKGRQGTRDKGQGEKDKVERGKGKVQVENPQTLYYELTERIFHLKGTRDRGQETGDKSE
jgi:hypothetical protein